VAALIDGCLNRWYVEVGVARPNHDIRRRPGGASYYQQPNDSHAGMLRPSSAEYKQKRVARVKTSDMLGRNGHG